MLKRVDMLAKGETDGAIYTHVFKSLADGSLLRVECSYAEYMGLREKGAGQPTAPPGYVWEQSEGANRFDTPSGHLEQDCCSEDEDNYLVFTKSEYHVVPKEVLTKLEESDPAIIDRDDHVALPKGGGEVQVKKDVLVSLNELLDSEK